MLLGFIVLFGLVGFVGLLGLLGLFELLELNPINSGKSYFVLSSWDCKYLMTLESFFETISA
jgi:hypothetical protein